MILPRNLTTATTLSKIIAASLFIVLPIIGFYLGMKYQAAITTPMTEIISTEKSIKQSQGDTARSLIKRCGEIPDEVVINKKHYDVVNGPLWAPDCRHIAWSLWESGTSYLGDDPGTLDSDSKNVRILSGREGIFVFNDKTKKTLKIYSPKKLDETPVINKWLDKDTIAFIADEDEYEYDITENLTKKTDKEVIEEPATAPSPIRSPEKAGWYRYMSKGLDFYLDYPNTYWYGGESQTSVSFEKKVDYPHRTSSWIFINDGIFSKEELDILNQMSTGEIKVIKNADDAIPSTFNTYERLPDFAFGTKKAKSFVNRSVWEGDHLYVYLYEESGEFFVFGGFTTESKDEKDYISYVELKEVLSTLRFMD